MNPATPWPARAPGLLLAFVLAAAATWPVILDLDGLLVGEKITSATYIVQNALRHPPWTWLDVPFPGANFPDGGRGVLVALPQIAVTAALGGLLGPYAALNLSLLLHLALGVWAGARLAALAWRPCPWPAAVAAGVTIGLGGFALGTWAVGQPENVGVGYVVLAVEQAWRWLRDGRKPAFVGALALSALAFLSSPYLMMGPLLAAPVPLVVAARRHGLARVAALGVALVVVVGVLAVPYRTTLDAREEGSFLCPASFDASVPDDGWHDVVNAPIAHVRTEAPLTAHTETDLLALLLPYGTTVSAKGAERLGYLGIPLLYLLFVFARAAPRTAALLLVSAAAPLVLSLGEVARFNGWALSVGGMPLRLPLGVLRELPLVGGVLDTVQVPARLALGAAIPLGLAAAGMVARLGPRPAVAVAALLVVEVLAFGPAHPPAKAPPLLQTDAHRWLATQPDDMGVLDAPPLGFQTVPFAPPVSLARRLLQTAFEHGHPVPYSGCHPPLLNARVLDSRFVTVLHGIATGTPSPDLGASTTELVTLGYGWITWLPDALDADPRAEQRVADALAATLPLAYHGDDGTRVYRLSGALPVARPTTPAPPSPDPR